MFRNMLRTFTCRVCAKTWQSEALGSFRICEDCKQAKLDQKRSKVCEYRHCGAAFVDTSSQNSMTFCTTECRRREKMFRTGKAQDESYFRANKVKLGKLCMSCRSRWSPEPTDKAIRCPACREKARHKVCAICGQAFIDDSLNANKQAHAECARKTLSSIRSFRDPDTLERWRKNNIRDGYGRIDDISTVPKYTHTWWGRVSELIFKQYSPFAQDMVSSRGSSYLYDFKDVDLGRVNVKGAKGRISPQGRMMWSFQVEGLKSTADTAFLVGYSEDRSKVEHLWIIPTSDLRDRLVRMAPGSLDYSWGKFEADSTWGLVVANNYLKLFQGMPETKPVVDKFAWLDDPSKLTGRSPGHRGRRGELLYATQYPDSTDMNRIHGSGASYDFEDPDGKKIDVKVSWWKFRTDARSVRWSFARRIRKNYSCDLYSCLCLDHLGTLVREYRIPASEWGDRRVIHIGETGQWDRFRVNLTKQGVRIPIKNWNPTRIRDMHIDAATAEVSCISREDPDVVNRVMGVLLRLELPDHKYDDIRLCRDFDSLINSGVRIAGDNVVGTSRAGLALCDKFFRHRYQAKHRQLPSVEDAWGDPRWLRKAISFQLATGGSLVPWAVFSALRALVRTVSNFQPSIAKAVIDTFSLIGNLVLDPCAGYGGRAVAALAAGRSYIGVDPHPNAADSFSKLFSFLQTSSAKLYHEAFEDVDLGDLQADLVFTSPPYFSVERYAEDYRQSWVRYVTWNSWVEGFLKPLVFKSHRHLKPGRLLCLNVSDVPNITSNLVKTTIDLALSTGFTHERTILMPIGRFSKSEKTEPILVFRKPTR
jgi:hypothetical protein